MFITNSGEKTLGERLRKLIRYSKEIKILVGYFYFSGVGGLYEELKNLYEKGKLKDGHIKVLVGLGVDRSAYGLYEVPKAGAEDFYHSLRTAFTSAEFDSKEAYEQVEFFIKLVEENKLILKKTKKPNHAKLYIFKVKEDYRDLLGGEGFFITGSSNLTKFGLESQEEFNVEIKDYGFVEVEKYFDERWKDAIEIDKSHVIEVIKRQTIFSDITPFQAYAYLLRTYIQLQEGKLEKDIRTFMEEIGYKPYAYQIEAVAQAVQNCEYHNGVIIADVVGLGKSVIASLTAHLLGKKGIVICPPHLMGDEMGKYGWRKYIEDFELYGWKVFSIGKLDTALELVKERGDFEVVIVDEAHRFRNELTQRYHYLREICRGKKVILLTATPFNNKPSDIFALLKLFDVPKKSSLVYDEDLSQVFEKYQRSFNKLSYIIRYANSKDEKKREKVLKYYKEVFKEDRRGIGEEELKKVRGEIKKIADGMRKIIEPVTIRRNRLDLKYYGEKVDFPEVENPIEVFFELTKDQLKFYEDVIDAFLPYDEGGDFRGALYFPARYEDRKEEETEDFTYTSQQSLYHFMRRLLVKRFESSFGAFKESIKRFKEVHELALEFVEKTGKFILDRDMMEELVSEEDEDRVNELLDEYKKSLQELKKDSKYHKVYEISSLKGFLEDLRKDKELFEELIQGFEFYGLDENDPKAQKLIEEIEKWLREKRKVVIFTEYVDTAKYLEGILRERFGNILLTAYGNLSKQVSEAIYKNFDAQAKEQEDKYQILLTTDKLSEGFNLNRAGVVINYDIPFNPVRVIQRVGRINRIGKKVYDKIYIVHFFPTEKGADIVKSREIAQEKMFMIHQVLGEDAKIFHPDEKPQPSELYRRLTTLPEEEESFFTKIRKEYERIKEQSPEIEEAIEDIPNRVKTAKPSTEEELCVFIKRGKDLFVLYKNYDKDEKPYVVSFEDVYEKIKADKDTPTLEFSKRAWEDYENINRKEYKAKKIGKAGQDRERRAFNLLKSLKKDERLKEYEPFISALIEDIKDYGTLSEYALSVIVDWEEDYKKGNINSLKEKINSLKEKLGDDFLEKVKSKKELEEEVIIAIENRRE